jgi:D-serine deaminase-like pyridoxal phosphate-dependent protein
MWPGWRSTRRWPAPRASPSRRWRRRSISSATASPTFVYAVGITPKKLDQAGKLAVAGADLKIITDDLGVAEAIARHPVPIRTLIEVDCGEARAASRRTARCCWNWRSAWASISAASLTHAGHSYSGRSPDDMADIAEAERIAAVTAANRLRAAGHACPIVSMGSSPTALYAHTLAGITEIRAGVYMLGDLFQAEIGTHGHADIAVTVLTAVIGRRRPRTASWSTPAASRCRRTAAPRPRRSTGASAMRARPRGPAEPGARPS